jgi:hypothetical protein
VPFHVETRHLEVDPHEAVDGACRSLAHEDHATVHDVMAMMTTT